MHPVYSKSGGVATTACAVVGRCENGNCSLYDNKQQSVHDHVTIQKMCSHYQAVKDAERFRTHFGVDLPLGSGKLDMWPGYLGTFVRRHPHADVGDDAAPAAQALNGLFGLVPHWSADTKIARHTFNARSETVAVKPSFRDAWKRGQRCIIPADAIYEPDWRSGKAVPTRIALADGTPMGIAGLWASWKSPKGDNLHSFTMMTINADDHDLMRQFHKPTDEKRMVVILPESRYSDWLDAGVGEADGFLVSYPSAISLSESIELRIPLF